MTLVYVDRGFALPSLDAVRVGAIRLWRAIVPVARSRAAAQAIEDPAAMRWQLAGLSRRFQAAYAEQVIHALSDGIERPCESAVDDIRSKLGYMTHRQLQCLMLTIKNRPVFKRRPPPFDALDSDLIGMLRDQLRGVP